MAFQPNILRPRPGRTPNVVVTGKLPTEAFMQFANPIIDYPIAGSKGSPE
jgi:hypothetical protein